MLKSLGEWITLAVVLTATSYGHLCLAVGGFYPVFSFREGFVVVLTGFCHLGLVAAWIRAGEDQKIMRYMGRR